MEIYVKKYSALSKNELFAIMQARARVFHLEQKITEEDFDDIDKNCFHMFLMHNKEFLGYIRIYKENEVAHLGRFLTLDRKKGYGKIIFKEAVRYAKSRLNAKRIEIHAQSYLVNFYKKFGFKVIGEPFNEAGIEHVLMIYEK